MSAGTPAAVRHDPELTGQTVVVIGGSAGIGLETARRARAEGAEVILTGRDLDPVLQDYKWPLERVPHMLETSLPGVFAVGDVRSGNVKRVAAAVGEGSISISLVHRVLAEL